MNINNFTKPIHGCTFDFVQRKLEIQNHRNMLKEIRICFRQFKNYAILLMNWESAQNLKTNARNVTGQIILK